MSKNKTRWFTAFMFQSIYTNDSKSRHLLTRSHQNPRTSHSTISLKATLRRSFPDGEKWHICSESLCCRKFWNCPVVDLIIFSTRSERPLGKKRKRSELFPFTLLLHPVESHNRTKRCHYFLYPSNLTKNWRQCEQYKQNLIFSFSILTVAVNQINIHFRLLPLGKDWFRTALNAALLMN